MYIRHLRARKELSFTNKFNKENATSAWNDIKIEASKNTHGEAQL